MDRSPGTLVLLRHAGVRAAALVGLTALLALAACVAVVTTAQASAAPEGAATAAAGRARQLDAVHEVLRVLPTAHASAATSSSPTYLWSLTASEGGTRHLTGLDYVLTLRDVDRAVVQFTDRPWRKVYVLHVRDFVRDWAHWFAADDEPNAVLSYLAPGQRRPQSIVVELSRPRYARGVLRLRAHRLFRRHDPLPDATTPVRVVRPQTPRRFTGASLFIDGAGDGLDVGAPYGGGIIAYVYQPGDPGYVAGETHGLIAAAADQTGAGATDGIRWAKEPYWYTSVAGTGFALGDGAANTTAIIAQNGAGTDYAAGLARAYAGGGFGDWFLPSRDELNKLYLNRAAIGGFHTASRDLPYYWSSSQLAGIAGSAWNQSFDDGSQSFGSGKDNSGRVRAVRAF